MPLYDYSCPRCGRFSALRPMAQHDQPQPCPQCGAISARMLSAVAIIGSSSSSSSSSSGAFSGGSGGRYRHMGGCSCCS